MQKEATDVFFSVTKLFQARDANLRRMVYLIIKEVILTLFLCSKKAFRRIIKLTFKDDVHRSPNFSKKSLYF